MLSKVHSCASYTLPYSTPQPSSFVILFLFLFFVRTLLNLSPHVERRSKDPLSRS